MSDEPPNEPDVSDETERSEESDAPGESEETELPDDHDDPDGSERTELPDERDTANPPSETGRDRAGGSDGSSGSSGGAESDEPNVSTGDAVSEKPALSDGPDDPDREREDSAVPRLYKQLLVGGAIVLLVLAFAAIAGVVVSPDPQTRSLADAPDPEEPPEPFVSDVRVDRIEAEGTVTVSENLTVDGGHTERTVLIEETGAFDQTDIRPLVSATTRAGHEIRFRDSGDLSEALEDADAYVLIDPRSGFSEDEAEAITDFTDDGGRLILLGNPDRVGLGASLQTVRTDMRTVAGEYGIVFGNRYLYDMADNDVTYRHVFAEPTGETEPGGPELNPDRVVLPTATHVESRDGTVLLRTPGTTELSDGGAADTYPVAVADGNVLAVGNTRFLTIENHNVADTEELVAYVVEFAVEGE